jgi:hypothetical protein
VKGFGCQPMVTYLRALRAGVRNPSPVQKFEHNSSVPVQIDWRGRRDRAAARAGPVDCRMMTLASSSIFSGPILPLMWSIRKSTACPDLVGRDVDGAARRIMRVRLGSAQASSEQPEDGVRLPPLLSPC